MSVWTAVAAALGAAVSFSCAAILQQEAAETVPREESMRLRLLIDLLRRPKWIAGVSFLLAGFGLQALALAHGPVALVQPIVVTELALAIPIAIWRRHRRAKARDWAGILLVLGGISTFLVLASPAEGTGDPDTGTWIASLTPVGCLIAAAVAIALRSSGPKRAMLLGAAAGMAFGLLAVLTKSMTYLLSRDIASALSSWQLYLVIIFGTLALVISQSAYQAGPLAFSMPLVALLEPLVAVVIGDTALNESVQHSAGSLALEGLSALVAATGIVLLSTSPTVLSVYQESRGNR